MDDLAFDADGSVLPTDAWKLVLGTPDHRYIYRVRDATPAGSAPLHRQEGLRARL